MCLPLFLTSYVSRRKRRGRYRLSDISEIGKVMGDRFYKRGKQKGGRGIAAFPSAGEERQPSTTETTALICTGGGAWADETFNKWLCLCFLLASASQFAVQTPAARGLSFSPSLQSFLSHSFQECLILSSVWAFLSAQSSSLTSFHFSLHVYYLKLVKSGIKSYKVPPMERRISHCVLTLLAIEFWSFPILWAQSWAQSNLGFNKPRDISIALPCLCFSAIPQYQGTVCIFLRSQQPPVTRQLPADLSALTCYVRNSIFFCTSNIPAVLFSSPHGYKSHHSRLIQLTF